jgi:multidrug efflux pump subunit AcrA (membrane-fusion protein)
MKTLKIAYTTILFAIIIVVFLPIGCKQKKQESQTRKKAPSVTVEIVKKSEIVRTLDLTGEVMPIEAIQISSTVDGPIVFCPWREGDSIKAGQKLIEIEREMYQAEVKAADAALKVSQAKLDDLKAGTRPEEIDKAQQNVREAEESATFAKTDMERIAKLVESGALPGEEIEKARVKYVAAESKLKALQRELEKLEAGFTPTTIAVQEAAVKEAAAKLELARTRLTECVITAPFAGTITKVFVRKGDMATTKSSLLGMADLSSLIVRCAVPEAYATEVRVGMKAEIKLDALPGKNLRAEITRIFPELDQRMRTRTVELSIMESAPLAPGMFARVRLILESVTDVITIPSQAVVTLPSGSSVVYIVVGGKATQRKVQTRIEEGGRIQILSGLNPEEQLIVSGQEKVKDGMEVYLPGEAKEGSKDTYGKNKQNGGAVKGFKGGGV